MTLLLGYWKQIAAVAIFAAYSGFVYWKGGELPRSQIVALQAAGKVQNAKTAQIEIKQTEVFTHADQSAVVAFAAIDNHWLRKPASPGKVPFPPAASGSTSSATEAGIPDTHQCNDRDSAHDASQVIALQKFYEDIRAAQQ